MEEIRSSFNKIVTRDGSMQHRVVIAPPMSVIGAYTPSYQVADVLCLFDGDDVWVPDSVVTAEFGFVCMAQCMPPLSMDESVKKVLPEGFLPAMPDIACAFAVEHPEFQGEHFPWLALGKSAHVGGRPAFLFFTRGPRSPEQDHIITTYPAEQVCHGAMRFLYARIINVVAPRG